MPHHIDFNAAEYPVKAVTIFNPTKVWTGPFGGATYTQQGKAEVIRGFDVELAEGENRVHIRGLSSNIEIDSARVSGLAEDIRVFDVVCAIKKAYIPAEDDPDEAIRLLHQRKGMLEAMRNVRKQESDMLVKYGSTLNCEHIDPEKAQAFLGKFVESGQDIIQAIHNLSEAIVEVDREILKLEEEAHERKGCADGNVMVVLHASKAGRAEMRLTYIVNGASWTPIYDLRAASDEETGQPLPSVELHFRARVMQSTGEEWSDTTLALSTASFDSSGLGLPTFKALRITHAPKANTWANNNNTNSGGLFGHQKGNHPFGNATPQQQRGFGAFGAAPATSIFGQAQPFGGGASTTTAFSLEATSSSAPAPSSGGALFGSAPATTNAAPEAPPVTAPTGNEYAESEFVDITSDGGLSLSVNDGKDSKPRTVVSESPFATTYKVDGSASIPSDGAAHQVLVATLPFQGSISWVTVPRAKAAGYLQCEVKNTSEYRLLPGPVNVFLDDMSVSRTTIEDINIGDTFTCTLGVDSALRITFARTAKPSQIEGGQYADQARVTSYTVLITIKNTHRFAIPRLLVRDGMPVQGVDKRVRVILRKPAKLVEAKEDQEVEVEGQSGVKVKWPKEGQKEGKLEWTASLEAGAEVKLEREFEVRGPADAHWVFKLDQ